MVEAKLDSALQGAGGWKPPGSGTSDGKLADSSDQRLRAFLRFGTGLAFIIWPLVFVFAFATHPDLLSPQFLSPEELVVRARRQGVLQFGHALVTLNTGLLIVAALHLKKLLEPQAATWGFVGATLAVAGALMLAADKGALCLTMSALDTLPDHEFEAMMPGLLAMFSKQGWLVLLWGLLLLPIGFGVQAVALLKYRVLPRWQGIAFLVGVLFIGTPDGAEIVNLVAALMLSVVWVPYGVGLIVHPDAPPGRRQAGNMRIVADSSEQG